MWTHFLSHIDIEEQNVHLLNGNVGLCSILDTDGILVIATYCNISVIDGKNVPMVDGNAGTYLGTCQS